MYKALIDCVIEGQNVKVGDSVDLSTWTPEQVKEKVEDVTIAFVESDVTASVEEKAEEKTEENDEEVSA